MSVRFSPPVFDSTTSSWFLGAVLLAIGFVTFRQHARARKLPLPPGPPGLPIIGNLLDMPSQFQWITFTEWAEQFDSDILYLNVAGSPIIILNSFTATNDLLDKRSRMYSDRASLPMVTSNELMGWHRDFAFMDAGDDWNAHRKIFVKQTDPMLLQVEQQNVKDCHAFLNRLLDSPDQFDRHLRYMFGAVILSIGYGIEPLPGDDPYIEANKRVMELMEEALAPGVFVVDYLPWLKYIPEWFPGATFKRLANESRRAHTKAVHAPFAHTKANLAQGIVRDSFVTRCLLEAQNEHDHPETLKYQEQLIEETAGVLYEGGTNTSLTILLTCILAMILHPQHQAKAQEELDRVVGNDRLPEHGDAVDLPFTMAIMKECLRWQPAAPLAIPHFTNTEDEYRGYRIPKGSTVIGNGWAILHDPKMYPDPDTFNPDRWLLVDADGRRTLNPEIREPTAGFGYGRRICPGKEVALSSIFIVIASILHSFNLSQEVDEHGNPIALKYTYLSTINNRLAPFKCSIVPRSDKHVSLIRKSLTQHNY